MARYFLKEPACIFLLLASSYSASAPNRGKCRDPKKSKWINPNLFTTDPKYSLENKLYGSIWYEHWYWTDQRGSRRQDYWTSFVIKPKYPTKGARNVLPVIGTVKERKSCKEFSSNWIFNKRKPYFRLTSGGRMEATVWFLDKGNEDFLLRANCLWLYKDKWTGTAGECDEWVFNVYFRDAHPRPDSVRTGIEAKLTSRICFPISKLVLVDSRPSNDCVSQLINDEKPVGFFSRFFSAFVGLLL